MKVNSIAEMVAKRFHRVKFKNEPINFNSIASSRGDCLVCMPDNLEYILQAASKLPDIASIFPNRIIKVLVTSNVDHRSHEYIKHFTLEKPYSYDITSFFLPKKSFIERLRESGIAICIDLDFEHNFFNSSVCVLTQAPLRIAAKKGLGSPYYNLEIGIGDREHINSESYDYFIKVLSNFKDKGEKVAPVEA